MGRQGLHSEFLCGNVVENFYLENREGGYGDSIKGCLRVIGFEGGRWMEQAQNHVQLLVLVLVMLNL
jgi:hypothetical protein